MNKVNLAAKLASFEAPFSPKIVAQYNHDKVEVVKAKLVVVPRGVEHCPRADEEAHILLIEPMGTMNTGDAGGPLTAQEEAI